MIKVKIKIWTGVGRVNNKISQQLDSSFASIVNIAYLGTFNWLNKFLPAYHKG